MFSRKNQKKPITKQNRLKYVLCIVGMVLLVAAAFFLPQIVFSVQDGYQMQTTETEVRNSLEVSMLNSTYEKDLNTRIRNFLNMQDRTVTAIDYEFSNKSELRELLDSVFLQDWFAVLYDNVMMSYILWVGYSSELPVEVLDCKKYLVHSREYQDGVALMMWYLDLYLEEIDARVRLLVDTESNTIYYAKITDVGYEEVNLTEYEEPAMSTEVLEKDLFQLGQVIRSCYGIYHTYYEADDTVPFNQYDSSESPKEEDWYISYALDEDKVSVSSQMPFGELCTYFIFKLEIKDGIYQDIDMGLSSVAEMIPEMMQD